MTRPISPLVLLVFTIYYSMIKKLANTLPNLVHTILNKLNKDDPRGEERGAPAGPSSASSSKPVPSSKQAKNPFLQTRDYLDHTLEAIAAKTGTKY